MEAIPQDRDCASVLVLKEKSRTTKRTENGRACLPWHENQGRAAE